MSTAPRFSTAVAVVAVVAAPGIGCGHQAPTEGARPPVDDLSAAAEPRVAPPQHTPLRGQIIPVGQAPEGLVVDAVTRTVAVATRNPNELVLIDADSATVTGHTPLPGSVRHLQLAGPGGPVLVPVETANTLVRVDLPSGRAQPGIAVGSSPHDATAASNGTVFVANERGGTVVALRGDHIAKTFAGSVQPAGMAASGTVVGMLDVRKNDLTVYDADKLTVVGSTPAGAGPTHLVADRHGRMIAVDTRGDAIRVFSVLPRPRQIASVSQPGAPYGIAYDAARDRLWVASSGANEVIGYDMTGSAPREVRRFPTVQNPYTLGVDSTTGKLFVAGVSGGVIQVINPDP